MNKTLPGDTEHLFASLSLDYNCSEMFWYNIDWFITVSEIGFVNRQMWRKKFERSKSFSEPNLLTLALGDKEDGSRWALGQSVAASACCHTMSAKGGISYNWIGIRRGCFTLIVKTYLDTAKSGTGGWNWKQNKISPMLFSILFNWQYAHIEG